LCSQAGYDEYELNRPEPPEDTEELEKVYATQAAYLAKHRHNSRVRLGSGERSQRIRVRVVYSGMFIFYVSLTHSASGRLSDVFAELASAIIAKGEEVSQGGALEGMSDGLSTPAKREALRDKIHKGIEPTRTGTSSATSCAVIAVDKVTPAAKSYPMVTVTELLGEMHGRACVYCSSHLDHNSETKMIAHQGKMRWLRRVHPLLRCAHLAFSRHRPMALSPDDIWLTIIQGVTQHLHVDSVAAEHVGFSKSLVEGQSRVVDVGAAKDRSWTRVTRQLTASARDELGAKLRQLFGVEFNTSTVETRAAMMNAGYGDELSRETDLRPIKEACGIPSITLLGSVDDWRTLAKRIIAIDELELGLAWWTKHLHVICAQFHEAAQAGEATPHFWQRMYKVRAKGNARCTLDPCLCDT